MTSLVLSEVTSAKWRNWTLPFSDIRPIKGIRHLREFKKVVRKVYSQKIVKESNSSERMNLANSLGVHTPKIVSFRHPPMQTDNVGHRRDGSVDTRVVDQDGIWRPTDRDVITTPTHGKIETISEKLAYSKFIKDSEIETRELFERENIENIGTQLETTRLNDYQMTRSVDSSKRSKNCGP